LGTPRLWVWAGSPDDKLDVLRYVSATEKDIVAQPCVHTRIAELEAEVERLRERNRMLAGDREKVTQRYQHAEARVTELETAICAWAVYSAYAVPAWKDVPEHAALFRIAREVGGQKGGSLCYSRTGAARHGGRGQ
jgi:hypothetical protein